MLVTAADMSCLGIKQRADETQNRLEHTLSRTAGSFDGRAAKVSGAVSGAVEGTVEASAPAREEVPPPPMPLEQPGTDYVRAVISGALSPRPKSAQELFMRTGSGWIPTESEYRLADKTA